MTECTTSLVDNLASVDLDSVADDLKGRLLIANNVYEELQLENKTTTQKARKIVMSVSNRVKVDPENAFDEFLDVLRSHAGLDTLLKTLEDAYSELVNTGLAQLLQMKKLLSN